jgi:hypothetical protein
MSEDNLNGDAIHNNTLRDQEKSPVSPDSADGDEEDSAQYPGKRQLSVILVSLNLAMFLVGLDNTIISTAIPKITNHFQSS